jgi:uncharacterized membrane protein
MPDIGVFHPQIVHFVIAFLIGGVLLRVVSLFGKPAWAGPAATALILFGALASIPAVQSGSDAHGVAERVPGARTAVIEHEEWGERTRNLFLGIALVELIALGLARNPDRKKLAARARMVSAAVGLIGLFFVYETGEHGGRVVYGYAGGVGTRSGDPQDVTHLLIAGLYHQAMQDRADGNPEGAARLIEEMRLRAGDDWTVQAMAAESLLRDRGEPRAALDFIADLDVPADNASAATRLGLVEVDALETMGMADSARSVLEDLADRFPQSPSVRRRLETPR